MSGSKPSFFIVGAPKCATTALYGYLKEHPLIFMPDKKEPHYFADELSDFFVFARDESNYLDLFSPAKSDQISGEASVMYLQSQTAVTKIMDYNPKAKFIAMIRNPVEAAISMHIQNIKSDHEDQIDFIDAWNLQDARAQGKHIPKNASDPQMLQYRDLFSLGSQIECFIETVPKDQRMIILYDDFKLRTKEVYEDVVEFLNLPKDNRQAFPVINPTKNHMSPLLEKRLSKIRFSKVPLIGPLLYFFHRINIYYIRPKIRPEYTPAAKPKPAKDVYAMLEKEFMPEIQKLEYILNRSLSHWFKYTKLQNSPKAEQ